MRKWISDLNAQVIERDEERCILCSTPAMYKPHHIVPRSRGKRWSPKLWRAENMCCMCLPHHNDGQKTWMRIELLEKMVELYDYDMSWVREFGIAWPPDKVTRTEERAYYST